MTSQDPFDAYPLAPFLASLGDDYPLGLRDYQRISLALRSGGPWSLDQLRGVLVSLVVREEAQEDAFLRRFDRFFDTLPAPPSVVGAKERLLADLRQRREEAPKEPPDDRDRKRRLLTAVAVVSLVAGLGLVLWLGRIGPETSTSTTTPTTTPTTTSVTVDEPVPLTIEVPALLAETIPTPGADKWQPYAGAAAFFLLALAGYGGYLVRTRRPPRDVPDPDPDPALPRLFDPGTIGGTPAPRLTEETLDVLADSLGYFRSETPSRKLDVAATVVATGKNAGLASLVFERRKQVRRVVILEDADAAPLEWNPIAAELATGLSRRGVPVVHGRFHGVPDRFRTADGELHLEDLEDELGDLVLLFSDGKGLRPGKHHQVRYRRVFDVLAHWPMVAWMEPREPRAWDAATAVPAGFGVPVYPASPEGLLKALGRFLTERAPRSDLPGPGDWPGLPAQRPDVELGVHVERLLGDALLWAQAAAMAMPPVAAGLADALRRRFHPDLPAERLARLAALPGTTSGTGGLRFSKPVLAVLRQGFAVRRSREEQEEVLRFLLERIREAEPADKGSAAHRAWEWRLERVRLELEPDAALRRLSTLAAGPLGEAIRGELADAALRGEDGVPLRERPRSRQGLQRLWSLNEDVGLRREEVVPPVSWQHVGRLAAFGLAFVVFAGMALLANSIYYGRSLFLENPANATIRYFDGIGREWKSWDPPYGDLFWRMGEVRVAVLRDGLGTMITIPAGTQSHKLVVGSTTKPCREPSPDIGLYAFRCAESGPRASWRETLNGLGGGKLAPDRLLSVGMELHTLRPSGISGACDRLLAERSVDVCFVLDASDQGKLLSTAPERIEDEIGPWTDVAQLVWWKVDPLWGEREPGFGPDEVQPEEVDAFRNLIRKFDRSVYLFRVSEPGDAFRSIADLLATGSEGILTETDLPNARSNAEIQGDGPPVYLVRTGESSRQPEPTPSLASDALASAEAELVEQITSGSPGTGFLALTELTDVYGNDERILIHLRKRENPFDVLEQGLGSVEADELGPAVLRVVELVLPLVDEEPDDPVRVASAVWALDYAAATNSALAEEAQALRDRVLAPLRRLRPPPRVSARDPDWVDVPAGTFLMGSPKGEGGSDEWPQHEVSLPGFRMLRHEVTIGEYRRLFPSRTALEPNDLPVASVNWYKAYTYAAWLDGRLPTEAEWEYAARAGCDFAYCRQNGSETTVDEVAWTRQNSRDPKTGSFSAKPVMQREPNPWGLYDMLGNLLEWTADGHATYPDTARRAPWVAASGVGRVIRGGSFRNDATWARVSLRNWSPPVFVYVNLGFRVVLPGGRRSGGRPSGRPEL